MTNPIKNSEPPERSLEATLPRLEDMMNTIPKKKIIDTTIAPKIVMAFIVMLRAASQNLTLSSDLKNQFPVFWHKSLYVQCNRSA
jgi:hypothetical protein